MIDRDPSVGRYILLMPFSPDGHFGDAGKITEVREDGIAYRLLGGGVGQSIEIARQFAAICDSEEEVQKLQTFSRVCEVAVASLREIHKNTAASYIEREKDERHGAW